MYTKGDGKVDHEQLSRDLSDAVIALNEQRRELLKLLKRILAMHECWNNGAYNGEAILSESVADEIRFLVRKTEKAMGLAVTP